MERRRNCSPSTAAGPGTGGPGRLTRGWAQCRSSPPIVLPPGRRPAADPRPALSKEEPAEDGGKDTGPTPTELLLASLASCYTLALRWAAKHRNLPLGDVQVTASGSYDGLKFGAIRLTIAGDLPPGQEAALLRDASRVCYVSNTLAASVPVEITLDPA